MLKITVFAVLAVALVSGYPYPQGPGGALPIPRPGADGSYGKGDYFQYINVPARKVFEWGYRRGNDPNHFREEYLSQKDHAFKAKLKWGAGYEGNGEMFFDYNHLPKYEEPEPAYAPVVPAYSPPQPSYAPKPSYN